MARGTVKFFNGAKGFGFIAPSDGSPDVFVHASAAESAGLEGLNEGDELEFEVDQDRRSGRVSARDLVLLAKGQGGVGRREPVAARRPFERASGPGRGARDLAGSGEGVVKWFNAAKGFGFIQPSDGGADVFVHATAVERAGLSGLEEGRRVAYDLEADRRTGKLSAVNLKPR